MASVNDFPARGKIVRTEGNTVVFAPANTNYELHLQNTGSSESLPSGLCEALLRISARKIWTVKSGGNFIDPIFGPPRKIQGRVRYLDDEKMVVQTGAPLIVSLQKDPSAYDMVSGFLAVGDLVNILVATGATFECLGSAVVK